MAWGSGPMPEPRPPPSRPSPSPPAKRDCMRCFWRSNSRVADERKPRSMSPPAAPPSSRSRDVSPAVSQSASKSPPSAPSASSPAAGSRAVLSGRSTSPGFMPRRQDDALEGAFPRRSRSGSPPSLPRLLPSWGLRWCFGYLSQPGPSCCASELRRHALEPPALTLAPPRDRAPSPVVGGELPRPSQRDRPPGAPKEDRRGLAPPLPPPFPAPPPLPRPPGRPSCRARSRPSLHSRCTSFSSSGVSVSGSKGGTDTTSAGSCPSTASRGLEGRRRALSSSRVKRMTFLGSGTAGTFFLGTAPRPPNESKVGSVFQGGVWWRPGPTIPPRPPLRAPPAPTAAAGPRENFSITEGPGGRPRS
mmetsp:Transcript_14341/g.42325  ORF Transcript_14341/g.42325 Transcript_14341/m.42325 type:complete len:360 (-) Transcript_14341:204-1283(-)